MAELPESLEELLDDRRIEQLKKTVGEVIVGVCLNCQTVCTATVDTKAEVQEVIDMMSRLPADEYGCGCDSPIPYPSKGIQ